MNPLILNGLDELGSFICLSYKYTNTSENTVVYRVLRRNFYQDPSTRVDKKKENWNIHTQTHTYIHIYRHTCTTHICHAYYSAWVRNRWVEREKHLSPLQLIIHCKHFCVLFAGSLGPVSLVVLMLTGEMLPPSNIVIGPLK